MKKILVLIIAGWLFLSLAPEVEAIKKIIYSVKDSTASVPLLEEEKVRQSFKCQPGLGGIDVKLSGVSPSSFIFRVKPINAKDWYFENEYLNVSFANRVVYPIGFPIIENCQQNDWLFEIQSLNSEQPLNVFYNQNNVYPDGEMLVLVDEADNGRFETKTDSDITFRLTTDVPFAEQIKNNLAPELRLKINQQRGFWILYFAVLAVVGGLLYKSYAISKNQ